MRNAYRILAVKPEGERPFRRPGRMCEDNGKTDLKAVE
jgi:hypothetical protein